MQEGILMSQIFKGKKKADKQKLRGGYYTPKPLADFLTEWAIRTGKELIVEPSCGDGNFVVSALERLQSLRATGKARIVAVELDTPEIEKAQSRVAEINRKGLKVDWRNTDFFDVYSELQAKKFNVVIGNPPFIRFQHFDDATREIAFQHLRKAGYRPTKLANAWAAFIQLSIEMLAPKGKLAMVVPAELLQVNYAVELRERIAQQFEHIIIVTFKKLVFPDIQQEVILLLAEGKRDTIKDTSDVHTVEINSGTELSTAILEKKIAHKEAKHARPGMKWTSFFLDDDVFEILDTVQKDNRLYRLGELAHVDIGIVTGRNSFFVLDRESVKKWHLEKFVIPLVGKTASINSIKFGIDEFEAHASTLPAYLLHLKDIPSSKFNKSLAKYIKLGEQEEVHLGYKCGIRKRWYEVPSVYVSDGFLFRQIHKYPLLVVNDAGAACTDTIHRVRLVGDADIHQVAASFINSLTFAWSEVCGRSYGGGVLELEPAEADELPIPYFPDVNLDFEYVNKCLSENRLEDALDYVDDELLIKKLRLTKKKVASLRNAWKILSGRRLNRK